MTTTHPTPYNVTLRPDSAHDLNRPGPSVHGYPLLRLDLAWGDHVIKTRDGSEFVIEGTAWDELYRNLPDFARAIAGRLAVATLNLWAAGTHRVSVYEDGCYHLCPVEDGS